MDAKAYKQGGQRHIYDTVILKSRHSNTRCLNWSSFEGCNNEEGGAVGTSDVGKCLEAKIN